MAHKQTEQERLQWEIGCKRMIAGFYAGTITDLDARGYDHVSVVGHALRMINKLIYDEIMELESQLAELRGRGRE